MTFLGAKWLVALALAPLLLRAPAVCAQAANDETKTALLAAIKTAALESEGTPPFRLVAKFETFDFMGRPASSGTLTEEFLKPGRRRQKVQTGAAPDVYAPEDEVTLEDEPPMGVFIQGLLFQALLHAGPRQQEAEAANLKLKQIKLGTVSMRCITAEPLKGAQPVAYCLAQDTPLLRMEQLRYRMIVILNKLVSFGGHTIAEDIMIQQNGRVRGRLQVQSLVAANDLKEADMSPPPDDRVVLNPATGKKRVAPGMMAGQVLVKVPPVYPQSAKQSHTSGQVVLAATIAKDGMVQQLEVISAPSDDLAEAALSAVRQWRYKPYLVNGEATAVETTITVNFSFG